eukprot:TRINITY_DN22387_c0_g5_i1.p1 TRINITY_DN22387_c0_g5~~TRINITY_DN22387_c0_g5_i1.p1  ORF type:complete len:1104 (-),score=233.06 TRINITY_DN22387_c0_g5_i1:115-3426(-)
MAPRPAGAALPPLPALPTPERRSAGPGAPSLDTPLLSADGDIGSYSVEIVQNSKEWAGYVTTSGSLEGQVPGEQESEVARLLERRKRYAGMLSSESYGRSVGYEDVSSSYRIDVDTIRCMSALLLFSEALLSTLALLILLLRRRDLQAAFCLLPSHLLALCLEVYIARKDRSVVRRRTVLRRKGAQWRLRIIDGAVLCLLGCCFMHTLVRAWRFWKSKTYRLTFLMELEEHDPARRDVKEARLDSLPMFVCSVPRVLTMVCLLSRQQHDGQAKAETVSFALLLGLSAVNILQAAVNFDYHASRYLRRVYRVSLRYRVVHVILRALEITVRVLVLLAGALAMRSLGVWSGTGTMAVVEYLLGVLSLRYASGRHSKKMWLMGFPLLVCDVGRYVDEDGFALAAQRTSKALAVVRTLGFVGALVVYLGFAEKQRILGVPPERCFELYLLGLLLSVQALRVAVAAASPAARVGDDLFTAALRDDVEALTALLAEPGCDANVRIADPSSCTPLHVAASHNRAVCARRLLDYNADPQIRDASGETPLEVARQKAGVDLVEMLLSAQLGPDASAGAATPAVHAARASGEALHVPTPSSSGNLATTGPPVESCDLEDIQGLFGPIMGGEHFRFLSKLHMCARTTAEGFVPLLFSKGVGEQLAHILESLQESASGSRVRLSALKTLGNLGSGGFGKVIKVMDTRSGDLYAMKLQHKNRTTKFAVREAQALHMSDHAFIVRLAHIFHTKTFFCLLMELCDEDLNARILRTRGGHDGRIAIGLAPQRAARYSACILLALEYLHERFVVFRDLKPENVLIKEPFDHAKLTDFGLARRLDAAESPGSAGAVTAGAPGSTAAGTQNAAGGGQDASRFAGSGSCGERFGLNANVGEDGQRSSAPSPPPAAALAPTPARGQRELRPRLFYASPPAGTPGFMAAEAYASPALCSPRGGQSSWRPRAMPMAASSGASSGGEKAPAEGSVRWEASRDWYALGCCLLLMLLGERGGSIVTVERRDVLLPPPADCISGVLRDAISRQLVECEDALELAAALTAPRVADRAAGRELRESRFLRLVLPELEVFAARHAVRADGESHHGCEGANAPAMPLLDATAPV